MIIGIDPSLNGTGLALLSLDDSGNVRLVAHECVKNPVGGDVGKKLLKISERLDSLIGDRNVEAAFIEGASYNSSSQKFTLGQVMGVCLLSLLKRDIPHFIIAPRTMKSAITGSGSGSKELVKTCALAYIGEDRRRMSLDESDAIAHAYVGVYVLDELEALPKGLVLPRKRSLIEGAKSVISSKDNKLKARLFRVNKKDK